MHSNRTLGLKGEKIVDRYCQSTASVKKNFTVMPILFADGTLSDKVYVCMQEPNDFFLGNHENTLTMIELVYHQLLNIRFKDSWNYAWYKPGYVEQRSPERFLNPREVCFPDTVGRPCQILDCE
uniref:COesterase domain-containing protein n=2 Tax=Bursaphelenchus xylophilus TaxID=6326 RepID=A0A1I7SP44_BURXY